MPEMSNRTICAVSAPVTVLTDELMAELVKRLPREACLDVLRASLTRAQERLGTGSARNRRSDTYKALKLTRSMADRLRPLPDDFALLLGEKTAAEVPMEGMTIDSSVEEFANITEDLPEFKQFASVFKHYPYSELRDTPGFGKLLVLGYCSGRGRHSNKLYRRNCILVSPDGQKTNFKNIGSAIGVLQDTGPDGTHYTIKAVPYADGMAVKFWTNIIGEGDVKDQYRYEFLYNHSNPHYGVAHEMLRTEVEWETRHHEYRAKKARQAIEADIAPAPLKG